MEQQEPLCPETGPGLCGCDRDIFARVWGRVMPQGCADSPIVPADEAPATRIYDSGAGGPDPGSPEYIQSQPCRPCPVPMPLPMPQPLPQPLCPPPQPPNCLGPASAHCRALLQSFIVKELHDHRGYADLARRACGSAAKTLWSLSADEKRHAKRLSTVYFLISGVQYWPASCPAQNKGCAPLPAKLRQAFLGEQQDESAYRAAAKCTPDPCLRELYSELAEDENHHGWLIRGILEGM